MQNFVDRKRGFTLIELLVVVAIIGLLSAVVLGSLQDARNKANDKALLSSAIQLRNALELYRADHNGLYPGEPGIFAYYQGERPDGVYTVNSDGGTDLVTLLSPYLKGKIVDPIYPDSYFAYLHMTTVRCVGQTNAPRYILLFQPKESLGLPNYEYDWGSSWELGTDFRCLSAPE